jgi:hypothetical protein
VTAQTRRASSSRVVKNDTGSVAVARANTAHAMPQVYTVRTTRALHRAVMDRDHRSVALMQQNRTEGWNAWLTLSLALDFGR